MRSIQAAERVMDVGRKFSEVFGCQVQKWSMTLFLENECQMRLWFKDSLDRWCCYGLQLNVVKTEYLHWVGLSCNMWHLQASPLKSPLMRRQVVTCLVLTMQFSAVFSLVVFGMMDEQRTMKRIYCLYRINRQLVLLFFEVAGGLAVIRYSFIKMQPVNAS